MYVFVRFHIAYFHTTILQVNNITLFGYGLNAIFTPPDLLYLHLALFPMESNVVLGLDDSDTSGEDSSSSDEQSEDNSDFEQHLTVTKEEVDANYLLLGRSVKPDPPVIILRDLIQKYPGAVTEQSERLLAFVLEENPLSFDLSDFQVGQYLEVN